MKDEKNLQRQYYIHIHTNIYVLFLVIQMKFFQMFFKLIFRVNFFMNNGILFQTPIDLKIKE